MYVDQDGQQYNSKVDRARYAMRLGPACVMITDRALYIHPTLCANGNEIAHNCPDGHPAAFKRERLAFLARVETELNRHGHHPHEAVAREAIEAERSAWADPNRKTRYVKGTAYGYVKLEE